MFVELLVLLILHFITGQSPERRCLVDGFLLRRVLFLLCSVLVRRRLRLHHHRKRDMIRILFNQTAQTPAVGKLQLLILQMEDDGGTPRLVLNSLDREIPLCPGFPTYPLVMAGAGTAG